jgi:hypothetical protein
MVSRVRKRDREMLVYFPLLGRVEKYVLNIYLNDKKRIMVEDVQAKIKKSYGTTFPRERILAIRNIAKRYKGHHETSAKKEKILEQTFRI